VHTRHNYSFLDLVVDLGGLAVVLMTLGQLMMKSFASHNFTIKGIEQLYTA